MEEERSVADKKVTKNEVVLRISDSEGATNAMTEIKDSESFSVAESSSLSPHHNTQMRNHDEVSTELMTTTKRLIGQSEFSKPKSRMMDPPCPRYAKTVEEKARMTSSFTRISRNRNVPEATIVTPRTPLLGTPPPEEDDDDEEMYKIANIEVTKRSGRKWRVVELFAFAFIMGFFIASLTVAELQKREIWGLKLWKWCVFILVILCGRLVTEWFINVLVFLIERNFLFKKKVLYFVYGVKKSVQGFIWLSLVLVTWDMLFSPGVKITSKVGRILNFIALTLASCLIGAALWLAKTLLIKLLASSFQSTRFFDRVQESIFHQYILKTLSGPPLMEMAEKVGTTSNTDQLSYKTMVNKKEGEKGQVIDVDKLKKMKQEKVSPLTMKGLINVIRSSGLSTISYAQDEDENEQKDNEINSEWEAKAAAYRIFRNVAKPGHKYCYPLKTLHLELPLLISPSNILGILR